MTAQSSTLAPRAALAGGSDGREEAVPPTTASLPSKGATSAQLTLVYGSGTLRVTGGAQPGSLYDGTFAGGVRQQMQRRGGRLAVSIRHVGWAQEVLNGSRLLDWQLRLSEAVPLDLELHTGASRVDLDLSGLQVRSLTVQTGASAVDVALPAHGSCRVEIHARAADVRVRVPQGVAASVETRTAHASVHVNPRRFPRVNGMHRSPDYEEAPDRADIHIHGELASFAVQ